MLAPPDPEMRSPADLGGGSGRAKQKDILVRHNSTDTMSRVQASVEIALGSIRAAVLRIDEIRQECVNAGLALKAGFVTPQMAIEWAETFAPGCLGYVPPESGLKVKGPSETGVAG